MPHTVAEVWVTHDTTDNGRVCGLHLTKIGAKRDVGPLDDGYDFVKLRVLTPEATAVLDAADTWQLYAQAQASGLPSDVATWANLAIALMSAVQTWRKVPSA